MHIVDRTQALEWSGYFSNNHGQHLSIFPPVYQAFLKDGSYYLSFMWENRLCVPVHQLGDDVSKVQTQFAKSKIDAL